MEYIKHFYLMKNFFGQIKKIAINYAKENINEIFEPYLLNDKGYLYKLRNSEKNNDSDLINSLINNNIDKISVIITNQNLVKVNYINYLDKENFNLFEYYGGFINDIDKKTFLMITIYNILLLFLKIIEKNYEKISKFFNKYDLFVYSLIMQIDLDLILMNKELGKKEQKLIDELNELVMQIYKENNQEDILSFFTLLIIVIPKKNLN